MSEKQSNCDESLHSIPGFDGYLIDKTGRVYSEKRWRGQRFRKLTQIIDRKGYPRVGLNTNPKNRAICVHKLMAITFLGPKPSRVHQVRHLDGIKTNNCIENLAWGTHLENVADSIRLGQLARGSRIGKAKLSELDIEKIEAMFIQGDRAEDIGQLFGVTAKTIRSVIKRRFWKHVDSPTAATAGSLVGTRPRHFSKLTSPQVSEIRQRLAAGEKGVSLAKEFGVSKGAISQLKHGTTWSRV